MDKPTKNLWNFKYVVQEMMISYDQHARHYEVV